MEQNKKPLQITESYFINWINYNNYFHTIKILYNQYPIKNYFYKETPL